MRKSKFGKETTFLWEGFMHPNKIKLEPTESTFILTEDLREKVDSGWEEVMRENPNVSDDGKWRTEFVHYNRKNLLIYISPIMYSQHRILKNEQGKPTGFYPNPLGINTIQETEDGFILFGLRGGISDQRGITVVGAGFVDRIENKGLQKPELLSVVQTECTEETDYQGKRGFDIRDARVVCITFGSNHDTGVSFHLPIYPKSKEIDIKKEEFAELILIPNSSTILKRFLEEGGYKGISAADQAIGCVESYLICKEKGLIKSRYQHKN